MFGFCISFNVWSFIEILDIFLLLGQECHQETVLLQFFLSKSWLTWYRADWWYNICDKYTRYIDTKLCFKCSTPISNQDVSAQRICATCARNGVNFWHSTSYRWFHQQDKLIMLKMPPNYNSNSKANKIIKKRCLLPVFLRVTESDKEGRNYKMHNTPNPYNMLFYRKINILCQQVEDTSRFQSQVSSGL